MRYEHFGISIVELMASGIVTIAHNSAGPKLDIIGKSEEPMGYLADNENDYKDFVLKGMKGFEE